MPTIPVAGSIECVLNRLVGAAADNSWQICIYDTGVLYYVTGGATNGPALTPAAWHHVALTWSDGWFVSWLDGVAAGPPMMASVAFDVHDTVFGADIDYGMQTAQYAGLVDDIRIYNRALADAEIQALAAP